jgi:signal transduction histidine kinase/DNA-binding response OmpR family regulator
MRGRLRWNLPAALPSGNFEKQDPEFRALIEALSRNGLYYAGLFAVALTVAHVTAHATLFGYVLTWEYGGDGRPVLVLWDKALIVALGFLAIVLSRFRISLVSSRLLSAGVVLSISLAVLIDDILNENVAFSAGWTALVLLVAVNTIPLKAWQTFLLGIASIGVLAAGKVFLPPMLDVAGISIIRTQMVYMAIVVIVLTAITSLLYRYRYQQFAAERSARALNRILEDRTAALEAEKEKTEEQAAQLMKMEEMKSNFFSNITHQFRTPLTLILGPAQDALEGRLGPLDPRLQEQIEMVHRNGLGLQHLIDQLLDLSRLDAGGMRLEPEEGDLQLFLDSVHKAFLPLAQRKHINFEYRANCGALWTSFDADKLEKALSNLLSNAIKFTPAGGKVRLKLCVSDTIEIQVRDSGPGIPDAELEHVFDRFYQARGITGDVQGSGIGLALAKELVELHGGTIRIESEIDFGTGMIVTLPLQGEPAVEQVVLYHPPEPVLAVAEPLGTAEAASDAPSVLVIDDNVDVRQYLRSHLASRYRVLEAGNGRAGIDLARKHHPDLIISDVMMPEIDGVEVCRTLKDDDATRDIPIVLLTAKATEKDKIDGLAARADDYMFKPFSATELLTRAENLIELRRMLRVAPGSAARMQPSMPDVSSADQVLLDSVRASIEKHMSNTNFGVEWLADEVALSARQLQRRLQAMVRLSAAGLIRMMRLQRAAQLLERRAGTVSEIAYTVGFQDAAYFARLFKQTYGLTPSEYAEQHRPEVLTL